MTNVAKKLPDADVEKIVVYSFTGNILLPTKQGQYWVTAVGGVIESRPVGNPHILFGIKYMWDMSGQVFEFPESIRIRLNTAVVATEVFDFEFPAAEVPAEESVNVPPVEEGRPGEGDDEVIEEDDEVIEEDDDDWIDTDDEDDEELDEDDEELDEDHAGVSHSEDELGW